MVKRKFGKLNEAVEDLLDKRETHLTSHGYALTAVNENGNTALHKAASKGYLDIVKS